MLHLEQKGRIEIYNQLFLCDISDQSECSAPLINQQTSSLKYPNTCVCTELLTDLESETLEFLGKLGWLCYKAGNVQIGDIYILHSGLH